MRRIIVGDVQGCSEQLEALLARACFTEGDRLYCVGDLVNRGPRSLSVLRRVKELEASVVLGNHDLKLLRVAAGAGSASRDDLFTPVLEAEDAPVLLGWLAAQPILRVEPDLAVVHGGLHPEWQDDLDSIAAELNAGVARYVRGETNARIDFATRVRHCDARGRRPEHDEPPPGPPFEPWDHFYTGARTVVFGHWARRGLVVRPRLRGLDTGCVYGGTLTAWIAEEDRFVQVPGWRERS
jgi:bis(5'-nucleosyl)-tetraphosphatase (symmetrical)